MLKQITEDISLGPPRTTFPSSRNVSKLSDFGEKGSGDTDDQDAPKSRFFPEKSNRKSVNEKEGRDNRESWTSARERRQLAGDDEPKEGRYGRRDRDHDGERRNGHGDKEGGWGSRRQNGERQGGWRDRERDKKDRDWDRGAPAEKEPEWMDDPAPSTEDPLGSMGMARNQEEFQKWKAAMSGKKVDEPVSPESTQPAKDTTGPKPAASLKLEGIVDKPFGGWPDTKPPGTYDAAAPTTKTGATKSKGSRFASMFKDQAKDDTSPAEVPPPKTEEATEDQAGFQRILQMLGGTDINKPAAQEGPSSPPQRAAANGTIKQKSRFTGFFDQTPKSPERVQSPPQAGDGDRFEGSRGIGDDGGSTFGGKLHDNYPGEQTSRAQPLSNTISPEPLFPVNGNREQQPPQPQQRMSDLFVDQPPSRGAATPDNNIQNLLASQRTQRSQGQDKNFLLDLLQTKGSRPASQQARPDPNFPLWLDQPPNMPEPHAPKPRAPPPPGLFEDQLLRNTPQEPPRQEPRQMQGNEIPNRRPSQRAPPGFFDEQNLFLQQQQQAAQRRNFTEPPQQQQQPGRRMSGHPNLPQMQIPQQHHQTYPGPPPDFLTSPGGHQPAPPPGFNPQMSRHPPGFQDIPNIFSSPHQQQGRQPPGFQGGMPGSTGGMQSPPNAPPGFFGGPQGIPPGYMGMRSPTEAIASGAVPIPGTNRRFEGFDGQMGVPRR
jgi:hypothetical protein